MFHSNLSQIFSRLCCLREVVSLAGTCSRLRILLFLNLHRLTIRMPPYITFRHPSQVSHSRGCATFRNFCVRNFLRPSHNFDARHAILASPVLNSVRDFLPEVRNDWTPNDRVGKKVTNAKVTKCRTAVLSYPLRLLLQRQPLA